MSQVQLIRVRHNFEMAHRLFLTPGKCEAIHGHSWWATLELTGEVDGRGYLEGIDFGDLKATFRNYLDRNFDHRVLLNKDDPWAKKLHLVDTEGWVSLPGLATLDVEPTTENLARIIGERMVGATGIEAVSVSVWETSVNNAEWRNS